MGETLGKLKRSIWEGYELISNYENGWQLFLFRLGLLSKVKTSYEGKKIQIKNKEDYKNFFISADKYPLKKGTQTYSIIMKSMKYEYPLNPSGKTVVDIGSGKADSALSFISRGAKNVLSYEIDEKTYNVANSNLKINGINSVKLYNLGVSGIRKENTLTLDDIVKKIEKPAILKLDCEGAEYSILGKASQTSITFFDEIEMEYHDGYVFLMDLLKPLGYRVSVSGEKKQGLLQAVKKKSK